MYSDIWERVRRNIEDDTFIFKSVLSFKRFDHFCRYSSHNCPWRDILRNHRAAGHNSALADGDARHDAYAGAQPCILADMNLFGLDDADVVRVVVHGKKTHFRPIITPSSMVMVPTDITVSP